jgi:adenosylcobinamide kinase / adenosylcobinamide-phosphate guanylyltransferase
LIERPPALRVLALGGIRSGKSAWAETTIAAAVGEDGPVRYLATAAPSADTQWEARMAAHRERRPRWWTTVESTDVAAQLNETETATLVDDMGAWLVAAMDRHDAWTGGSVRRDVDELANAVGAFGAPLVLVSPEVGLTVVPATESGRLFADALGELNQRLAAVCDRVVLVIAGQPLIVKESQ